ncbi:MAG: septal ring lytic transglycosylase RlpA family protein [Terriglobales bacterium]|jgi:rare lipoprotein A
MRRRIAHGLAILILVSLGAAQGPNSSGSVNTQSPKTKPSSVATAEAIKSHAKPYQVGTASWYGDYFVGKPTASGEPYNMYDLTAAHPTLPLGSWIKVTNLRNRKVVVVRVNDRGPIVPGRILDLSYGAAQVLQFNGRGLQTVRIDVVHPQAVAVLEPMAY